MTSSHSSGERFDPLGTHDVRPVPRDGTPTVGMPRTADLWLLEDRCIALEKALKRVMRNQAALLTAWAEGERYDEDSDICGELAGSRVDAKAALDHPFPRFSIRPDEEDR